MSKKRNRQWFMGALLAILTTLVWWVYFYSPLQDSITEANAEYTLKLEKKLRVKKKIKELEAIHSENMIQETEVQGFANLMIPGKNLEEMNAVIQQKMQNFMDKNSIPLQKYLVSGPGRWMDYDVGVLEFTVTTNHNGLASLLRYLEELKQLVRIGQLNINYSRSRENNLHITFRLETLFVDKD
ncbi:MAG: hypothetical protein HQK62_03465 [Desulfamplus sp.]|nr:hypothetical protein [Desulfamplus sp.]